jgi:large subunit ribosomal protein L29
MKAKDLRERTLEDLRELEKSLTRDAFTNRFKNFTNRLDDTSSIRKARRDLARVKTILGQLEAKAAAKGSAEGATK